MTSYKIHSKPGGSINETREQRAALLYLKWVRSQPCAVCDSEKFTVKGYGRIANMTRARSPKFAVPLCELHADWLRRRRVFFSGFSDQALHDWRVSVAYRLQRQYKKAHVEIAPPLYPSVVNRPPGSRGQGLVAYNTLLRYLRNLRGESLISVAEASRAVKRLAKLARAEHGFALIPIDNQLLPYVFQDPCPTRTSAQTPRVQNAPQPSIKPHKRRRLPPRRGSPRAQAHP